MNRETILDLAIKVLVSNPKASLQDIAAAAGIARSTLHRHFTTRDDLMRVLTVQALEVAEQAIAQARLEDGPARAALERVVRHLVPLGHHFHFLLDAPSFDTPEIKDREERLNQLFDTFLRRAQVEGVLRSDFSPRWLNDVLTMLIFTAWQSVRDGYTAPRDAPQLVLTTFLDGAARPS